MMIKIFEKFNEPKVEETYYSNGRKRSEIWKLNGKEHREDGPAVQWWYENGQIEFEIWYLDGKYHREDGHAYQVWYSNGQKAIEYWYLNGKEEYTREEWIEELKNIRSHHYEEQRMLLDMEKYNI